MKTLKKLLVCLVLLFSSIQVHAVAGVVVSGVCFSDSAKAATYFRQTYPKLISVANNGANIFIDTQPSVNIPNHSVSYHYQFVLFGSGQLNNGSVTAQPLEACDDNSTSNVNTNDLLLLAACAIACIVGIRTGLV